MASAGRERGGRGGRGGSPTHKRARHDGAAGNSSLRPPVEVWRVQARERGARSRSAGKRAWTNFDRLDDILWPTTKRLHEAEREFAATKETVVAREDGVVARLAVAKEEYDFAFVLFNSVMEYYLGVKKDDK